MTVEIRKIRKAAIHRDIRDLPRSVCEQLASPANAPRIHVFRECPAGAEFEKAAECTGTEMGVRRSACAVDFIEQVAIDVTEDPLHSFLIVRGKAGDKTGTGDWREVARTRYNIKNLQERANSPETLQFGEADQFFCNDIAGSSTYLQAACRPAE